MFSVVKTVLKVIAIFVAVISSVQYPTVLEASQFAVIEAYRLNMRSGPDRRTPSIRVLKKGTRVRVLKRLDGWLEIYHQGQTGFIRNRKRYVRILKQPSGLEKQAARTTSIEAAKNESLKIEREIARRIQEVKAFSKEERTLINGLEEIDLSLNKARKRISEFRSELSAIDGQLKETAATVKALLKNIKQNETYVRQRLVALYKLDRIGRMQMLASAESIYDLVVRKAALERILAYDQRVRNDLLSKKRLLAKLTDRLNAQRAEKVVLEKKYKQQIQYISKERAKRQRLLSAIRSKRSLELAAVEALKQAAAALDRTIVNLSKTGAPLQTLKKPLQNDFISLKGSLKMPVNGTIVSRFGAYTHSRFNLKGFRSGIHIKADRGEPIRAVFEGIIIYSNWFKGYGNMIIIDHGNSYYTVYAHAEELFKSKGDKVQKEEVIGTVGDTGSMVGTRLYFEVRHHGKPLNPLQWIKKG
ncbi:MAG: peptidoglycan DD-metalloendopeptidase family protein [Deltaproteobacteria bacterium]|nr:peptidoglycan DD-metalloendopeptidase family protein [Deltaproteobacteria bacterium]MBW2150145.1 peptidoglycan DD-metalloendopeptidase family protein [Deltaproteobacteria bacterium]